MNLLRSQLLSIILAALALVGYATIFTGRCGHEHGSAVAMGHERGNGYVDDASDLGSSQSHDDGLSCECPCHVPVVSDWTPQPVYSGSSLVGAVIFGERAEILSDVEPRAIEYPPQLG